MSKKIFGFLGAASLICWGASISASNFVGGTKVSSGAWSIQGTVDAVVGLSKSGATGFQVREYKKDISITNLKWNSFETFTPGGSPAKCASFSCFFNYNNAPSANIATDMGLTISKTSSMTPVGSPTTLGGSNHNATLNLSSAHNTYDDVGSGKTVESRPLVIGTEIPTSLMGDKFVIRVFHGNKEINDAGVKGKLSTGRENGEMYLYKDGTVPMNSVLSADDLKKVIGFQLGMETIIATKSGAIGPDLLSSGIDKEYGVDGFSYGITMNGNPKSDDSRYYRNVILIFYMNKVRAKSKLLMGNYSNTYKLEFMVG